MRAGLPLAPVRRVAASESSAELAIEAVEQIDDVERAGARGTGPGGAVGQFHQRGAYGAELG
jgi:hypothetical protein